MSEQTEKRKKNEETQKFFESYSKFKTLINIEREHLNEHAFASTEKFFRITSVGHYRCSDIKKFVNQFNKNENDTGLDLKFYGLDLKFYEYDCSVSWNWE